DLTGLEALQLDRVVWNRPVTNLVQIRTTLLVPVGVIALEQNVIVRQPARTDGGSLCLLRGPTPRLSYVPPAEGCSPPRETPVYLSPARLPRKIFSAAHTMTATIDTDLAHHTAQVEGGVNLHYVEAGPGPLIVLLHGYPAFSYD